MQQYNLSEKHARVLDKLVAERVFRSPKAALGYAVTNYLSGLRQQSRGIIIDPEPADNGRYNTQKGWIELYNAQEGEFTGKRMIASFDVINAPKNALPETLVSLQADCRESIIVTGTHNSYQPNTLAGRVIHHYQSKVVMPEAIALDEIPVLEGVPAYKVVKMPSGLLYVKALVNDRNANSKELLDNLVKLAQREPGDIYFWTPTQDSRKNNPERAVWFLDGGGWFHVLGYDPLDDSDGRSRGVSISPRSGRAKK